jgi:hypothetical protein
VDTDEYGDRHVYPDAYGNGHPVADFHVLANRHRDCDPDADFHGD